MLNYNKLFYFFTVAQQRNLTRAAELLHISQPSLSKAIMDLESELGYPLFFRINRKLQLTRAGEYLYSTYRSVFSRENEILSKGRELSALSGNELRFGFMMFDLLFRIPDFLKSFNQLYPDMRIISSTYIERVDLTDDILEGKIDVGLKLFTMDEVIPDLRYHVLRETNMAIVTSQNHPMAGRESVDLYELKDEPFISLGLDETSSEYRSFESWCHRCGFKPNILMAFEQVLPVLSILQSGIGVALLSDFAPIKHMPGLITIPINNAPRLYSGLFWNPKRENEAIRCFVREFAEQMQ